MTVAFDARITGGNSSDGFSQQATAATSISTTGITVGASATILVVELVFQRGGAFVTGVTATWNGVTMTSAASLDTHVSQYVSSYIFILVSPASGAKTLSVSWTGSADCYMGASSFTGGDTSTGINASDTQTGTGNLTMTTVSGDATLTVAGKDSNDPTVNNTKIWGNAPYNPGGGAQYKLSTTTSDSHTFTFSGGDSQATCGIHLLAGGGAAPATPSRIILPHQRPLRKVGHPMYPHRA